jgi:lysozyme family protein
MLGNFIRCCGFTLAAEGGFCNVQGDPGGATNHGITMATLSRVLGRPATVQDVQALTDAQAEAIYQPDYWAPIRGDELPVALDLIVFDFGVNAGPERSVQRLQGVLGVAQDGNIGPATLAALGGGDVSGLIMTLTYSHVAYYQQLPGYGQFGNGWMQRAFRAQDAARAMLTNS